MDKRPITIKIPTNKQIPPQPETPSGQNSISPRSPEVQEKKPEVKRPVPSPPSEPVNTSTGHHSAPKIIKSSVGKRPVVPEPVSRPEPTIKSELKPKGSAQLEALKNAMREKSPGSPLPSRRLTPEPVKSPVSSPVHPGSPVQISSPLPEPGDLTPSPEPLSPKKVEFRPDLGSVEGTNQSVKEWTESMERKAANSMAEIRKKISKKEKADDKKHLPELKEIQVRTN